MYKVSTSTPTALGKFKSYFQTGQLRVRAASVISANAATIVKEAVAKVPTIL